MHITTILGSPRLNGNTAVILKRFEEKVIGSHNIERINVAKMDIHGCIGCWKCQTNRNSPGCIFTDDGSDILNALIHTDLIVYASPVYVWGFTSQLKALLDRQCSLLKYELQPNLALLENKPVMLVTTCAGANETNSDLISEIFNREMEYLKCINLGVFSAENCKSPHEMGETAASIAQQISAAIEKYTS